MWCSTTTTGYGMTESGGKQLPARRLRAGRLVVLERGLLVSGLGL